MDFLFILFLSLIYGKHVVEGNRVSRYSDEYIHGKKQLEYGSLYPCYCERNQNCLCVDADLCYEANTTIINRVIDDPRFTKSLQNKNKISNCKRFEICCKWLKPPKKPPVTIRTQTDAVQSCCKNSKNCNHVEPVIPWTAAIFNGDTFLCGGVLFTSQVVLTSFSCIADYPKIQVEVAGVKYGVEKKLQIRNLDVGIIKIDRKVEKNSKYIETLSGIARSPKEQRPNLFQCCGLISWKKKSDGEMKVHLQHVNIHNKTEYAIEVKKIQHTNDCKYDGGSPVVCVDYSAINTSLVLLAIVPKNAGSCKKTTMMMDLGSYRDDIMRTVRKVTRERG